MHVEAVPCLRDNYAYIIVCPDTNEAAVVDPSEAGPVWKAVKKLGVELVAILNTHHHWDHVGGNKKLLAKFPSLRVYGHASDRGRIPGQTEYLDEGDSVDVGHLSGGITHNPGHTTGAVTYYFEDAAFTGDTLFAAGCGRLFEGTPEHMYTSLYQKIGKHPETTRLFFGHEYTESNLRFAQTMEPSNTHITEKLERVRQQREAGEFTTPSLLSEEWKTNPFMRCGSTEILARVRRQEPGNNLSPAEVLRVVRALKDRF